jgi:hypothetical protein
MSNHTKGPWVIRCSGDVGQQGGALVASVYPVSLCVRTTAENKANARLIAAAPDLLEALDELANGYAGNRFDVGIVDRIKKARAALAKARGDHDR